MNNIKSVFSSKTIWLAVAQGVVGVIVAVFAADPALKTTGVGAIVKSIVDIYLRMNTTQPVSLSGN